MVVKVHQINNSGSVHLVVVPGFIIMCLKKLIVIFILFCNNAVAQNKNSIWCFGDSAGVDFSNVSNPIRFTTSMDSRGSCASIADSAGNLLFYAGTRANSNDNTAKVWNKNHQIMVNGDSIVGEAWYNELVIVPSPASPDIYYLFSAGVTGSSQAGLYYSVINITLNNGLGAVVQKNVQLLSSKTADCLTALRHGNGRDWWLLAKLYNAPTSNNRFFVFCVSDTGISAPVVQDFNNAVDASFQRTIFNQSGNKFMHTIPNGFMCEYTFDRCSGIISSPNIIFQEQSGNLTRIFWDGAYAPNDSIFYASSTWLSSGDTSRLLQFNLFAPDIPASCDTLLITKAPVTTGALKLAPDNKIYYSSYYQWAFPYFPFPSNVYNQYNMNLSVINNPNQLGSSCNFQAFSFPLGGKRTYAGLPNNPNYSLGPLVGSICDTLHLGINEGIKAQMKKITVFYERNWQTAFINVRGLQGKQYSLNLYDILGHLILRYENTVTDGYATYKLNCFNLPNGVYFVSITTGKEKLSCKFMKD